LEVEMDVKVRPARWGYEYVVELQMVGGPRHGKVQEFHLASLPSAAALTYEYRFPETLADGTTRWDIYALQRNAAHEPVALTHDHSFTYDPKAEPLRPGWTCARAA
jgi:hypothetical protein